MNPDEKYSGFLEHIQRNLGPVRDAAPPDLGGANRGFAVLFPESGDGDLVSAVTNGVRFQDVTAIMPEEFVCTLRTGQRAAAHLLVRMTAELVIRTKRGLVLDQVISAEEPMVEGTDVHGVVVLTHPYLDDDFESLLNAQGRTELHIYTLVPLMAAEIAFLADPAHEPDDLYELWETEEVDLLDINRPSAV